MSHRAWVGKGRQESADFCSCDFASLEDLAEKLRWKLPAKLSTDDPAGTFDLLLILYEKYAMGPDEFWTITIVGKDPIEHPTWDEVEEYFGMKRMEPR